MTSPRPQSERTYRIIETSRNPIGSKHYSSDRTVVEGLSLSAARAEADRLDAAWRSAHPECKTSWTATLHFPQLENPDPVPDRGIRPAACDARAAYEHELRIIRWVCRSNPVAYEITRDDKRWWRELPAYQREMWRHRYEAQCASGTLLPAYLVEAHARADFAEAQRLAESWAEDIRTAFKERKPCPIIPTPQYKHVLDWAFALAQMEPENLLPASPIA